MLYPKCTETRELSDLSGIWRFAVDREGVGRTDAWYAEPLTDTIDMPVPASYNDITVDPSIRDHVGDVWYETDVVIPRSWHGKAVILRVGAAAHHALVYCNGRHVARHKGGFLPFECDVSEQVSYGATNRLTMVVNNELDWQCLPTGEVKEMNETGYEPGTRLQEIHFDFFNYSGIHRPVKLLALPRTRIDDIAVRTTVDGETGVVSYRVVLAGETGAVRVRLLDEAGECVAEARGGDGELRVEKARLWHPGAAYLYTLEVCLEHDGAVVDRYPLEVGIRTVEVRGTSFLINGRPFYFKGFGKHEDMDVKGRGLDHAMLVRDFNLLEWIGANSFRTSHYPYAEEVMRMADRRGIVIIDEVPAVGMNTFKGDDKVFTDERVNADSQAHHLEVVEALIARDKNHPSVVMWSVGNEPASAEEGAPAYFAPIFARVRELDPTRPVTCVEVVDAPLNRNAHLSDVILVNRYDSWYWHPGRLQVVEQTLEKGLAGWYERFGKPVVISEFGADTIAGMHQLPAVMFTEEYQREFVKRFHAVFDRLPFVVGEHIWNFADFGTKQGITRVGGNKKGIFTRQRQPKSVAFDVRDRWRSRHEKW